MSSLQVGLVPLKAPGFEVAVHVLVRFPAVLVWQKLQAVVMVVPQLAVVAEP